MALDTQNKRLSAIHLGSPWRGMLPIPDGTIGQGDRQHVMFLCSAVLAATLNVVAGPYRFIALDAHDPGAVAMHSHDPGAIAFDTHDPGAVATASL